MSAITNFDLHKLGWRAFEDLCGVIAREILGQTVQVFADGRDGGRDGAFSGTWKAPKQQTALKSELTGKLVIQCKFSDSPKKNFQLSLLSDELAKARELVGRGSCDSYLLLTNMSMPAERAIEIEDALRAEGVKHPLALGKEWINQTISMNASLRRYVPRVYGLGDVSLILDERSRAQSTAILAQLKPSLERFVITRTYVEAARALSERRIIVLIGEPAVGKSLMAATLTLAALDDFKSTPYQVSSAPELIKLWNPDDPGRTFWADDAFGSTRLNEVSVEEWGRHLRAILTAVHAGNRVIITSRAHLYQQALTRLKASTRRALNENVVEIRVEDLNDDERAQLLYNHLKFGSQTSTFRTSIKPYLKTLSKSRLLRPEMARRLGNPEFTSGIRPTEESLQDFIERPMEHLQESLQELDDQSECALASIYVRRGRLDAPVTSAIDDTRDYTVNLYNQTGLTVASALSSMKGSFVQQRTDLAGSFWTYAHPTIGEALELNMQASIEKLGIFLRGLKSLAVSENLNCGAEAIIAPRYARRTADYVFVPPQLRELVVERLNLPESRGADEDFESDYAFFYTLLPFLLDRCDDSFFAAIIDRDETLWERVMYRYERSGDDPCRRFLLRMGRLRGFTSAQSAALVKALSTRAMAIADPEWAYEDGLGQYIETDGWATLRADLQIALEAQIEDIPDNLYANWTEDTDPEAYFEELLDNLWAILENDEMPAPLRSAATRASERVDELREDAAGRYVGDWDEREDIDLALEIVRDGDVQIYERDRFDDVDH